MQNPGLSGAFFIPKILFLIAFILVYLFFSVYYLIIKLKNRVMRFAPCAGLLCNSFWPWKMQGVLSWPFFLGVKYE